ncbi:RNA polymerase sigma factor [Baekduia alba]|uniref:RNA polymerase sigma factor n=1 Tax=Baekduia alba TaxID=2997333 RepID=UPI002340269F|nr:sigma-70 family RNA polymerase sigma factor [Baekduia alba]WCB96067.1 RNA polymerase sigma factor [Baekduia alba]
MQAVRAGDDHAFERLYHRYHRRISAYIFGMVHDHGRAEDLTQEVFVSALRRMRQTDREIAFKPWVYEIAKNACIDAFRRAKRTEEVSIDADDGHGLAPADHGKLHATAPTPEAAVEGKQNLANLTGAFGGLSDAHHQILVMRELEGLSYREIGEQLGMSRPSVESTLFRARRRLTEEYEELKTGERCLRIQEVIGRGVEAGGRLGMRDQRRLSSHVSHCHPCRRHAVMAGLDAGALARRPVRAKLGALLPIPAFIKRRWFGGGGTSDAAQHAPALAKASLAAAQYGEPTMAGWMKATAVATAVAVAGVGAGAAKHVSDGGGAQHRAAPVVERAASGGSPAAATGAAGGGARRTVVARAAGGGAGSSSHTSSAGSAGRSAAGAAGGQHASGTGTFSGGGAGTPSSGGGGTSGSSGSGSSSGGGGGGESASSASKPGGGGGSSSSAKKPASGATDPLTSAVDQTAAAATGAAGAATGGGGAAAPQPLIQPSLAPLTQPASTPPPQTAGQVVSGATDVLGGTVGGQAGEAVKQTGAAVGDTVDKVTTGLTDAATGLLGGGK